MLLNGVTYVPQVYTRFYLVDTYGQAFVTNIRDPLGDNGRIIANVEHLAGVTVEAIFNDGNVHVDNIPIF